MSFTVRPITPEEYAAAQAVWDACFPEDAAGYSDYYFACRTKPAYVLAAFLEDGRMAGALHALPYPLCFGTQVKRCAMVAGVATLPEQRHKGIAAALIRTAHARLAQEGVCAALLKPDVDFYAQFGYRPFAWHEQFRVEAGELAVPEPALHTPSAEEMLACYDALAAEYNGMMVRTVRDMELMRKETAVLGGEAFAAGGAYALCLAEEGGAELTELVGRNAMPLVYALAARFGAVRFRLPCGARPEGLPKGERMMFSMLCPLNREALLAGSGAESMEELLSGAKKPNCTLEFC